MSHKRNVNLTSVAQVQSEALVVIKVSSNHKYYFVNV